MSAGPSLGTCKSLNAGSQSSAMGELTGSDDCGVASQDEMILGRHCRSGSEDSKASTIQAFPSSPPIRYRTLIPGTISSCRRSASSGETVSQSASPLQSRIYEEGHRSSSEEFSTPPNRHKDDIQQNDTPTRRRTQGPTPKTATSPKRISSSSPELSSTVASQDYHKISSEGVPMTPSAKKRANREVTPPQRPRKSRPPRLANKRLRRSKTP